MRKMIQKGRENDDIQLRTEKMHKGQTRIGKV